MFPLPSALALSAVPVTSPVSGPENFDAVMVPVTVPPDFKSTSGLFLINALLVLSVMFQSALICPLAACLALSAAATSEALAFSSEALALVSLVFAALALVAAADALFVAVVSDVLAAPALAAAALARSLL